MAGVDLSALSHLDQGAKPYATKGQLMTAIDQQVGEMDENQKKHFNIIVLEEILNQEIDDIEYIERKLSRLGWTVIDGMPLPIEIFDFEIIDKLNQTPRSDMIRSAQRLRDGDLGGAISSACGAVDSATSQIYGEFGLGDPTQASFQERCKVALKAKDHIKNMESNLIAIGWDQQKAKIFSQNFDKALSQGAYVVQTLRANMGDVHGNKEVFEPLAFDAIKWSEHLLQTLHNS